MEEASNASINQRATNAQPLIGRVVQCHASSFLLSFLCFFASLICLSSPLYIYFTAPPCTCNFRWRLLRPETQKHPPPTHPNGWLILHTSPFLIRLARSYSPLSSLLCISIVNWVAPLPHQPLPTTYSPLALPPSPPPLCLSLPITRTAALHRMVAALELRQALEDEGVQNLGEIARL